MADNLIDLAKVPANMIEMAKTMNTAKRIRQESKEHSFESFSTQPGATRAE